MIKTDYYTNKEGGTWIKWPDNVKLEYRDLLKRSRDTIKIGVLDIHSIAFDNPKGINNFFRWDCINGFND